MKAMKRTLRRFRGDSDGNATVEFALLIPALGLVLGMAVEISAMVLAEGLLETAAMKTARIASTGYTSEGKSREQTIQEHLASETFGLLSPLRVAVASKSYTSYSDLEANPEGGTNGFGGPNDVVRYSFSYPWDGLTPLLRGVLGAQVLTASVAVRNEPFE